jgi:hypothetical protein
LATHRQAIVAIENILQGKCVSHDPCGSVERDFRVHRNNADEEIIPVHAGLAIPNDSSVNLYPRRNYEVYALNIGVTDFYGLPCQKSPPVFKPKGAKSIGTGQNPGNLKRAVGVFDGGLVVLVPDEAHRDQSRLYQKVATDQYGHYLMRGIAPGDYKIFCWDEVEVGAWEDPDFLRTFEDRGQKISVEDADAKTVDVVAIRMKSSG